MGWFMGEVVGDVETRRKIDLRKMKYGIEAFYCLVFIHAPFKIFQRSGAKICVKHQTSFWGALEGWAKSDSWVILKRSQKIAIVELKQDENVFCEPALSSSR